MSTWNPMRVVFETAVMVGGLATSALAVPLPYSVVVNQSDINSTITVDASATMSPDPLNQFQHPMIGTLSAISTTRPNPSSSAVADVGLPGNFNNGANGITISQLTWSTSPGTLEGFALVPVPLSLTGSRFQFLAFTANVASLSLTLDSPLTSSLTPLGTDQWAWTGLGNVTISGVIDPTISIPTKPPVTLGAFPFSESLTMPLAGTFSAAPGHTDLTLGIPTGTLKNQSLSLPPIDVPLDLTPLGAPVTGFFSLSGFVLGDLSTAIVYRNYSINSAVIPEPGTGLLICIGLLGFAVRRRH